MATRPRLLPFRPPARKRLHEDVAEQLRDAILDGRFPAGRNLPPERELALEFRVNRTSVREAIKVLEGLGLVTVRQGDGARVLPIAEASFSVLGPMIFHGGRVDGALLGELGEVMLPLLLEMARLAIARRQPGDVDVIRALRDRMADDGAEREARFAAGRELLVHLADMTRNRVWQMVARRGTAFLAEAPLAEARHRLRRDPGRAVPVIDVCIAAIDAGRDDAAISSLQQLVWLLGDPEARSEIRSPTTKGAAR
ncbi:MAG TPA: GntR family transcriptional regulator [Candidatus Binatia bacterium]|nr:GntR family transcriptional regulator [Candidatus Binatia bacterium]